MNTLHDPFENDLRALQPRGLPAEWRQEILSAAAAPATAPAAAPRTPRWLLTGWGLAWAATLVLHFTTPAGSETPASPAALAPSAPALQWERRLAVMEDMLATN